MAKVQIHVTAYNEANRIEAVVRAILEQSFSDFTLVIHDNHSTDRTVEICRRAAAGDRRVFIDEGSMNIGAVMQGSRVRCGYDAKYIALRSANDLIHPDYLRETVGLLDTDPSVALAYSHGMDFRDDLASAEPSPDGFKIDTRGMGPFAAAVEVMQRYTASFSLWGVYRRTAFESCRPYQFMHGGDHVWLAEMALYGAVAPIEGRLDYRHLPPITAQAGIVHNAKSQLEEDVRGIAEQSFFYGVKQHLPFTDMAWGHVEMFSLARVDDALKQNLILAAREIFRARFLPFLTDEAARFTQGVRVILENWGSEAPLRAPNQYVWLLKARKEIDKIRFLQTADAETLCHLEDQITSVLRRLR
jgi:hypothetical protein